MVRLTPRGGKAAQPLPVVAESTVGGGRHAEVRVQQRARAKTFAPVRRAGVGIGARLPVIRGLKCAAMLGLVAVHLDVGIEAHGSARVRAAGFANRREWDRRQRHAALASVDVELARLAAVARDAASPRRDADAASSRLVRGGKEASPVYAGFVPLARRTGGGLPGRQAPAQPGCQRLAVGRRCAAGNGHWIEVDVRVGRLELALERLSRQTLGIRLPASGDAGWAPIPKGAVGLRPSGADPLVA